MRKDTIISNSTPSRKPIGRSLLDTKETLLHFSRDLKGSDHSRSDFYKVNYRWKNITLKKKLEASEYRSEENIDKLIRRLEYCSSSAMVEVGKNRSGSIKFSSKKCRHAMCHVCNRAKSKLLQSRFEKLITEHEPFKKNRDLNYYYLTLTLKHDDKTRTGNYLKELKACQVKLLRSKLWKNTFTPPSGLKKIGVISSVENSIKSNGYHIHSHLLICCSKLKRRVKTISADISSKWYKITGDSSIIDLKLVRHYPSSDTSIDSSTKKDSLLFAISDLFKYSTKTVDLNKVTEQEVDKLCNWIIDTKGKNFLNCSGLFRGYGLTACRSDLDELGPEMTFDDDYKYYLTKTTSLQFNVPIAKHYDRDSRKKIFEFICLTGIKGLFADVSGVVENYIQYRSLAFSDNDMDWLLKREIQTLKEMRQEMKALTETMGHDKFMERFQLEIFN